jgi:MoaA/NifB/PqqE/SkfB family radical SAM enzyme
VIKDLWHARNMRWASLFHNRLKIWLALLRFRIGGAARPIFAHLLLTNKCNLKCKYCFVDVNTNYENDLSLTQWKNVVSDLARRGTRSITLMGGEPLMFDGLENLIEHIKKYKINVDMVTNGIGIHKHLSILKKLDSIMVSLDGNEAEHDVNRGRNSFKHAIEAIKIIRANGVPLRLNAIVNKKNVNSLSWLLNFAKIYKIPITFNIANSFSETQKSNEKHLMLDESEVRRFYSKLKSEKNNDRDLRRLILYSDATLDHVINYPKSFKEIIFRRPGEGFTARDSCWFGKVWIHIDSDGSVIPCSTLWNLPDIYKAKSIIKDGMEEALSNAGCTDCKTCYWPAPVEWRDITSVKGIVRGASVTLRQILNQV